MKCLKIGKNDGGQKLIKFVEKTFPKFSRSLIYKAIRTKKIKINRKRCFVHSVVEVDDVVEVFGFSEFVNETKQGEIENFLAKGKIKIVYEDENLLIVDKPVGLSSQPSKAGSDSLISRILNYLIEQGTLVLKNENSFLPAICNRLDTNSSGLVVAAKNFRALKCFNELLKSRKIVKTYVCLAEGVFEKSSEVLFNWLGKNRKEKRAIVKNAKFSGAKEAILQYFVIEQFLNFAKVKIILHTGRFHQIRAQLSKAGHPLVGDVKYGSSLKGKGLKMKLRAVGLVFNTKDSVFDYLDGKKIEIDSNF